MAQPAAVLSVLVTANTKQATAGLVRLNTRLASTDKQTQSMTSSMRQFGKTAALAGGVAGVGALVVGAKKAFGEFREAQKVTEQTNAVLKSTGNQANVTAKAIEDLAEAISLKSGIDDEAIQKGENLLLTFTKIRNETGKGNDVFNQATQVITDMSVALDQDLKSSAIQVGKALQDPEKGITALRRVGVNFTQTQSDMIQKWVEHGDQLRAQKFILRELTTEFGGSAEAQADNADRLRVAWDNLFERIGKAFGPAVEKAMGEMARFIRQMETGKGDGGEFVDSLKEIARAFRDMRPAIEVAAGAVKWIQRVYDTFGTLARDMIKAIAKLWTNVWTAPKKAMGDFFAATLRAFAKVFEMAGKLPFVGKTFDRLADKAHKMADEIDKTGEKTKDLHYELKTLPKSKRINIKVDASVGAIKYGGFNPLTGRPQDAPPAGGPGSILDQIGGKVAGKVDGKRLMRSVSAPGNAPGKLGMLEELGHRSGLYTSSGYRPGDKGFHGQNRARDMAGSPANMLAYARMLYNTYGTSINELIHTPLGVGIDAHRAGRLTSLYDSDTLADHYDHVHVAMAKGGRANQKVRALVGEEGPEIVDLPVGAFVHTASKSKAMMRDRIAAFAAGGRVGTFGSTSYGPPWGGINGMGVTATGVDLTRSPHLHGIAVDPNVLRLGSKYWLAPNPFDYKGPFKAFDTGGAIKGNRVDFYDWRGRTEQYGWGRRNVTVYDSDPFGAVKKVSKKPAEKLAKIVKPKKKGTLNRHPYGGIGKSGILNAFVDFQTNRLNMWSALAALNDVEGDPATFLDDIAVAMDAVKTWETWLNVAQLNNIPEGITTTATNLKSARDRLKELTTPDTSAADAEAAARAAERAGLLEQLLREANQRTAVSQAQYGALRYGGQFAEGGVVPGPIGRPSLIVAHGGETVTPPGASNVQVIVNGDIVNTPRGKKPVEVRDIRGSGRAPLPGGGGGWH